MDMFFQEDVRRILRLASRVSDDMRLAYADIETREAQAFAQGYQSALCAISEAFGLESAPELNWFDELTRR